MIKVQIYFIYKCCCINLMFDFFSVPKLAGACSYLSHSLSLSLPLQFPRRVWHPKYTVTAICLPPPPPPPPPYTANNLSLFKSCLREYLTISKNHPFVLATSCNYVYCHFDNLHPMNSCSDSVNTFLATIHAIWLVTKKSVLLWALWRPAAVPREE